MERQNSYNSKTDSQLSSWLKLAFASNAVVSVWAVAALYFDLPKPWIRVVGSSAYAGFIGALILVTRCTWKGIAVWVASLALVLAWWFSLSPTNTRAWQPDVAQLPFTVFKGNQVTVHNVRNFNYRTEMDYVSHWETRTVDLTRIRGVDLFLTHFGSPLIAHAIVSFRFGNDTGTDTFIAMSIEQRKAIGQSYSTIRGFFRQYELIYIAADERDVVRLRTNYRTGEQVRLYHTLMTPDDSSRLFLRYLQWMENLRGRAEWYNALTDNCTTSVTSYLGRHHVGGLSRWDWRTVINGFGDRMLYDDEDLATGGLSFDELARQAVINDAAKRLRDDPEFSRDIRRGHPGF